MDTLIGWFQSLLRGRSIQVAQAMALFIFLIFSYLSYTILVDHDLEYPWYPKRMPGIELRGGYRVGTFGFPYSREWREIGRWFERLPKQHTILVTNEKQEIARFYLPSTLQYRYGLREFPGRIRTDDGLHFLIISGPQSWMDRLWGWSLDEWHQKFVPHDFVDEEGRTVASVYFLTQEQIDAEFIDQIP